MTNDKGGTGEAKAAEAALQRMISRGAWIGRDLREAVEAFGARVGRATEPGDDPTKVLEWAGGNLLAAIANVDVRTLSLVRAEMARALVDAPADPREAAAWLALEAGRLALWPGTAGEVALSPGAARLVALACASLALADATRADEAWLLARSRGEATEPPDPERAASYRRMEDHLRTLPPESPGDGWQARVWAKIDEDERTPWWRRLWRRLAGRAPRKVE